MIDFVKLRHNLPKEIINKGLFCVTEVNAKYPFSPKLKSRIASNGPDFLPFEELEEHAKDNKFYETVGLQIKNIFSAIDIDDVISNDGLIKEYAKDIIELFDSYTEISPSGKGIRILFLMPEDFIFDRSKFYIHEQHRKIEFYDAKDQGMFGARMVRLSGNPYKKIRELKEIDIEIVKQFLSTYMKKRHSFDKTELEFSNEPANPDIVLATIYYLKHDQYYISLDQRFIKFPSESEADFAMCRRLSEYTNNINEIKAIFNMSNFYKDKDFRHKNKWDVGDYADNTIKNVLMIRRTPNMKLITSIPNKNATPDQLYNVFVELYGSYLYENCLNKQIIAKQLVIGKNTFDGPVDLKSLATAIVTQFSSLSIDINFTIVQNLLGNVAKIRPYHPVYEKYIELLRNNVKPFNEIESTNYIERFFINHAYAEDVDINLNYTYFYLLGTVAKPLGFLSAFDTCPIFKGPAGSGKSSTLKIYINHVFGPMFFKENLPPTIMEDSRDYYYKVGGAIVAEIAELKEKSVTSDIFHMMNDMISTKYVTTDLKYGSTIVLPNYTCYYTTCNNEYAIPADFDNRRYFVINCGENYVDGKTIVNIPEKSECESIFVTLMQKVLNDPDEVARAIQGFLTSKDYRKVTKSSEVVSGDKIDVVLSLYLPIVDFTAINREKFLNEIYTNAEKLIGKEVRNEIPEDELLEIFISYDHPGEKISKKERSRYIRYLSTFITNLNAIIKGDNNKWARKCVIKSGRIYAYYTIQNNRITEHIINHIKTMIGI